MTSNLDLACKRTINIKYAQLQTGNIFVYTGMLEVCGDDDELGVVLSHEIAHTVLGHIVRYHSYLSIIDSV